MKAKYRCSYCLRWLKSLEELDTHRVIHTGYAERGEIDISLAVEIPEPQIAQPETLSGEK